MGLRHPVENIQTKSPENPDLVETNERKNCTKRDPWAVLVEHRLAIIFLTATLKLQIRKKLKNVSSYLMGTTHREHCSGAVSTKYDSHAF